MGEPPWTTDDTSPGGAVVKGTADRGCTIAHDLPCSVRRPPRAAHPFLGRSNTWSGPPRGQPVGVRRRWISARIRRHDKSTDPGPEIARVIAGDPKIQGLIQVDRRRVVRLDSELHLVG